MINFDTIILGWRNIMNNQFLNAKNAGICQKLVGKINYMIVFVDDADSQWYEEDIRYFNLIYQGVVEFFLQQSKKYHISLEFKKYSYRTYIPISVEYNNAHKWDRDVVMNVWHESIDTIQSTLKQKLSCDEVPILFLFNKNGRSNAHNVERNSDIKYEYAIIFFQANDTDKQKIKGIAHESCHLFGASDYYYPDQVCENAKKYLENSIMNFGDDYVIDSLTAYCIGWTNMIDNNAQNFINKTNHITQKDIIKGRKDTAFNGFKYKQYDSGTIYIGDFVDNHCEGNGLIKYDNGDIYQGEWINNQMYGYGTMIFHTSDVYNGEWKNNVKDGFGVFYENNGYTYIGDFKDNQRNGLGLLQYPQGWLLYGHWLNGLMNGEGIMILDDCIYLGEWQNNRRNGQAVEMHFNGDVYAGNWKDDYKDGHVLLYCENDVYECQYHLGQLVNKIKTVNTKNHYQKYDNGAIYYGNMKNHCINGKGLIRFNNGDIYYGDWMNNVFDGFGFYYDHLGNVYIGHWQNHQKHGKGIWIDSSGEIYRGEWQNNQLVKKN